MNKILTLVLTLFLLMPTQTAHSSSYWILSIPVIIKSAEIKYSLPDGLLAALVEIESAGKHQAINQDDGNTDLKAKGLKIASHGLVQIQLGTARLIQSEKAKAAGIKLKHSEIITAKQLMRPETNIEYGAMYLKYLLDTHENDVSWALTCYNTGPYSKTCSNKVYYGRYVGKILNAWVELKASRK